MITLTYKGKIYANELTNGVTLMCSIDRAYPIQGHSITDGKMIESQSKGVLFSLYVAYTRRKL